MEEQNIEHELIERQVELKSGDMAKILGIAESTVRKYAKALENAGYQFRKDENHARVYTENDQLAFMDLITARKEASVGLDMAASIAVTRRGHTVAATQSVQLARQAKEEGKLEAQLRITNQELAENRDLMKQMLLEFQKMRDETEELRKENEKIRQENNIVKEKLDKAVDLIQEMSDEKKTKKSWFKRLFE